MFTVKNNQTTGQVALMALAHIYDQPMQSRHAFKFKRLMKALEKAKTKIKDRWIATVVKDYAEHVDGKFVPEQSQYGFKVKEGVDPAALAQAVAEFGEQPVTIYSEKLLLSEFEDVKISPQEAEALEPFCHAEPEEAEV